MTFWKKKKKGEEQESQESTSEEYESEAVPAPTVKPIIKDEDETRSKPRVVARALQAEKKPRWFKRNLAPTEGEVKKAVKRHEEEGTELPGNVKRVLVAGRLQETVAQSGKTQFAGVKEARRFKSKSVRRMGNMPGYYTGPMARGKARERDMSQSAYPGQSYRLSREPDILGSGKDLSGAHMMSNPMGDPLQAGKEIEALFSHSNQRGRSGQKSRDPSLNELLGHDILGGGHDILGGSKPNGTKPNKNPSLSDILNDRIW